MEATTPLSPSRASPSRASPSRASTSTDRYVEATRLVPAGETRTFAELAALAGRPGAARAAGRALSACPIDSPHPWHRVVASDGSLFRDKARAQVQIERLRAEGALAADVLKVRPKNRAEPRRRRAARLRSPAAMGGGDRRRRRPVPPREDVLARLSDVDWPRVVRELRGHGAARVDGLLAESECACLLEAFDLDSRFERTIEMGPRGYGVGTYRYWKEPIPEPARAVRAELYERLRTLAAEAPGAALYPPTLEDFWERCRKGGQKRASSILLRYGEGGVNFPHRDIYGQHWFPYQAVVVLSKRGADFEGGEFVLFEEAEGQASRERAFALDAGDLLVFASRGYRAGPRDNCAGARGDRAENGGEGPFVQLKHGMRPVTRGERLALGLVLHLAE